MNGSSVSPRTFIPQMEPSLDDRETEAIANYMRGEGWLTEFRETEAFAEVIAAYTGAKYAAIAPNGTVSLTIALLAAGVRRDDHVIVPDCTMIATANAVILAGAAPVFADVERSTLCLSVESIRNRVTPRTKAIILVTLNGRYPHDLIELVAFCRDRGIVLIEDAAQSLGSFYGPKHLGTFGVVGSFSFSAPKIITTGQGGALITDDADLFARIRGIRDFGRECSGSDRYVTLGWNFKFTDLQAVVGIEQMKKIQWRVRRKKEMYRLYQERLVGLPGIEMIPTDLGNTAPWFIDVLVDRRADLINHLRANGIGAREFYPALHSCPVYRLDGSYPVAEDVALRGLWLPSSVKITDGDIDRICETVKTFGT